MRRFLPLLALVPLVVAASAPGATSTYSSHQLHAAIPDQGILDRSIQVPDAGPVSFVAVGVRIVHPRDSDLTLSLVSPRGTVVPLSVRRGGDGANFGTGAKGCSGQLTWFESDALDPISTGKAPFDDQFKPDRPLTALNGQEARGRWTLRVADGAAGATGMLLCWQLELSRNVVSHVVLTRGPVSADLTYRETHDSYRDVRIVIHRHGVLTLAAPLSRFCPGCLLSGYNLLLGRPLTIADLDGDGEPEVLVDLYTGGAHCCFYTVVLRYDGHSYEAVTHLWGDPGYELSDLDHDGRPELVSADDRFADQFTAYASSLLPVQVWRYDHGMLTDVTSQYPDAWLADEYRLGLGDEGWAKIRAAYARGELSSPRVDPIWPAGQKYLSALRSFLVKTGYALR